MDVSHLSHGAAKLLLAAMLTPEIPRRDLDLRLKAGITDYRTYHKSVEELVAKVGIHVVLATFELQKTCNPCSNPCSNGNDDEAVDRTDYRKPVMATTPITENLLPLQESCTGNRKPVMATPVELADSLDGSGDPTNRTSPYQVRRKAQIDALTALYVDAHPYALPPSMDSVKDWLVVGKDSAVAVAQAIEKTRGKRLDYPAGYIKSVIKGEAAKAAAAPVVATASFSGAKLATAAARLGPEYGPPSQDIMREATAADRAKWEEADRKLKAMGLYVEP